jgi:hypothetical protein
VEVRGFMWDYYEIREVGAVLAVQKAIERFLITKFIFGIKKAELFVKIITFLIFKT